MSEEILGKVRLIVSDIFNVPLEEITSESSPESIENWDSMQQLNLVLSLEDEFSVNFEPEEIEKLTDVKAIVVLIQKKLKVL